MLRSRFDCALRDKFDCVLRVKGILEHKRKLKYYLYRASFYGFFGNLNKVEQSVCLITNCFKPCCQMPFMIIIIIIIIIIKTLITNRKIIKVKKKNNNNP